MICLLSKRKITNKISLNTMEDNKEDGAIPFLNAIVKPDADVRLSITVYRKPTSIDQYLQGDSQHHLSAKYSVINTLTHRAKTVCSKPELFQKEMAHFRKALTHWKYSKGALDRVERRLTKPTSEDIINANNQGTAGTKPSTNEVKTKCYIVIPYTQGLCKSIKKICSRYGIQTHFKGKSTIKSLLALPKDKTPWNTKVGPSTGSNVGTLHVMRIT